MRFFIVCLLVFSVTPVWSQAHWKAYAELAGHHFPGSRVREFSQKKEQVVFPIYGFGAGYQWETKRRFYRLGLFSVVPRKLNRIIPGTFTTLPSGFEIQRYLDLRLQLEGQIFKLDLDHARYSILGMIQTGTQRDAVVFTTSAPFPRVYWDHSLGVGACLSADYTTPKGRSVEFSLPFTLLQFRQLNSRIVNPILTYEQQRNRIYSLSGMSRMPMARAGISFAKQASKSVKPKKNRLQKRKRRVFHNFHH
jgi:hypothetical protein